MAGSQAQKRAAANARAAIGNQAALVRGSAAAKARMAQLRALRGNVPVKTLSPRAAKVAFTKHYNKRSYKTSRARQAAKTRDLCTANKPVVTDRRYLRSPHRYDYPGLDDGSQCPTGKVHAKRSLSAAQKAALVARLPKRGGAAAEHCEWHQASMRCAKASSGGVHEHCRVNKKGHCVKKASAPKDAARVARGKANVDRLAAARVARGVKRGSPKAPAMPAVPRRAPAAQGLNLQEALATRCTGRASAEECAQGVNCSWTPAHTHKGKEVAGKCGNKKGRYSLATAQARDARK